MTLPSRTTDALRIWLEFRGQQDGPLFTNFDPARKGRNGRLAPVSIYRIVTKLGRMVGLKVWPHAIRHSSITRAYELKPDPVQVQKFARHKDIGTTMIYVDGYEDAAGKIAVKVSETI